MKIFRSMILGLLVACSAALCLGCESEKEDGFRVVDYSYILQKNTPDGPQFAYYSYVFSYIRGPITEFTVNAGDDRFVPGTKIQDDLFETHVEFGSFEEAVAPRTLTVTNQRNQSVVLKSRHDIKADNVLYDFQVLDILFENGTLTIDLLETDDAYQYGYFAIPLSADPYGNEDFYRANGGRPVICEALDLGREYYDGGGIVLSGFKSIQSALDPGRYQTGVMIVPVAVYETWEGGRLIVESEKTFIINQAR